MAIRLHELYYHSCDHINLKAGDSDYKLPSFLNIGDLVGKALKRIFSTKKADVDPDLMEITYSTLNEAVNIGAGKIEYGKPNYDLAQQLRESGALFAAGKSWHQAKELAALTVRPDGKIRSWEEFQTLAAPVVENYNQTWLKTEYNTGIRAARSAIQWKKFEASADLYPNLEYMPSTAATPSDEHKVYYHIIKPIQDDFWIKHMPPSRYNCQCSVSQTDDDVSDAIPDGPDVAPGLDNNPGLTGKLFSDNHPYISTLSDKELKIVTKKAKQYVTKRNEDGSRRS
ncbi:phage head morphogenesis protein [Dyadobacter frigoris]|uniref:Phage head morphogenesis domain-containing protein n=1 Tax=Dyadobacter frigoris TaxID=2576211 RepID=A0A4U6CYP1_9BACT|nr:hypothetical protein [Dyadobacter frigoris]TKT89486.1 hypothetical protein FDK13_24395 [Dyadobacter frigoris]